MSARYTRESVARAVGAARSLSEVVSVLGGTPSPGSRAYLRRLLRDWRIDASHLEAEGVRHTERRLRAVVREASSVADVVRRLGISPVGGNQAHIARRIAALDIDTGHFGVRRRATPAASSRGRGGSLLVLGAPGEGRIRGDRLRRALLRAGVQEKCGECGQGPEWQGRPLRLEVDHVNGRHWDNRPDNLRLLCPNCHAVTDTHRGRRRARRGSGAGG